MPELSSQSRIIYIHGFNSSPDAEKAQEFARYFSDHFSSDEFKNLDLVIPELSHDPRLALALLEELVESVEVCFLVGSSLGGYYATYLAEKYKLKAALINPAVSSSRNLGEEFMGMHTNSYSGKIFELTREHVDFFSSLDVGVLQYPQNFMLLVQTGDEVLDYRLAVEKYAGSLQIVESGGDHRFVNVETKFPGIFEFSGLVH